MRQKINLDGLELMHQRLDSPLQKQRMINDKAWSMKEATKYSYQAARLKRVGIEKEDPGLINPDTVKQAYDNKILSVDTSYGYKVGDVFEWMETETMWLIYLQDLDELAYFKGKIRKCNYKISWTDEDGEEHTTYAAVQGPLANDIDSINRSYNVPNYDLKILIPKDEDSVAFFKRYTEFYLYDLNGTKLDTRWRVAGVDAISQDEILTFTANEYYANMQPGTITTTSTDNGIVLLSDSNDEPIEDNMISGESSIRPKIEYSYIYHGKEASDWSWTKKKNLSVTVVDQRNITIKWNGTQRTTIELVNGTSKKTIKVESLF